MASLNEIKTAELTANSHVSSVSANTEAVLGKLDVADGGVLKNGGNFFGFGSQDFVGINANGLGDMMSAIDTYCERVTAKLEEFEATANTKGHFAGQYAESITSFMKSIKSSCIAQVDALKKFKTDLETVVTVMKEKDAAVADNINSEANSIAGASTVENN